VIERCGFVYEGTLKQATVRYDGVIIDEVLYYLDLEQYQKIKHLI
jgi:RimJ/RimL family protein N-acetyltransferase